MILNNNVLESLQSNFIFLLQKKVGVFAFDRTDRSLILPIQRKELYFKYSLNKEGNYYFYFTQELLPDLDTMANRHRFVDNFCIALFCIESKHPCVLTYPEFRKFLSDKNDLSLTVKINKKTFTVKSKNHQTEVSKTASMKKVIGNR